MIASGLLKYWQSLTSLAVAPDVNSAPIKLFRRMRTICDIPTPGTTKRGVDNYSNTLPALIEQEVSPALADLEATSRALRISSRRSEANGCKRLRRLHHM